MNITINTSLDIGDRIYLLRGTEIITKTISQIILKADFPRDKKVTYHYCYRDNGDNKVIFESDENKVWFRSKANIIKKLAEQL